jgi:hypothetical protein
MGLMIHQTSIARRGPANNRAVIKQHIFFLLLSIFALRPMGANANSLDRFLR